MRAQIEAAEHIALIAHAYPDADALGSACAMYAYLLRLEKKVTLFCASERLASKLTCIPWSEKVVSKWNDAVELAIAFDCGSYERMGIEPGCTLVNIDHHTGNDGFGDVQLVDQEAVSTTAILLRWFKDEGIKINPKMATALYAGIADDTLGFMSRRTDASVFGMSEELGRYGADIEGVNHALFLRRPLSALRLKSMIFAGLELRSTARIAVMQVTREMMEKSGAETSACDNALHEALGLPTIQAAMLLRERHDGSIKVSLRTDDGIDVGKIATEFGGGGHHYAAGFIASGTAMEPIVEQVIETIEKEME